MTKTVIKNSKMYEKKLFCYDQIKQNRLRQNKRNQISNKRIMMKWLKKIVR